MSDLKNKVTALNKLIISGDTVKAMEIYYSNDIEMQENDDIPRKGRRICIETERNNLQKIKSVECTLLNQAIDEEKNVVFSEWKIAAAYKDNNKFLLIQVSVQHWLDGQVAKEKFYYKSFNKVD